MCCMTEFMCSILNEFKKKDIIKYSLLMIICVRIYMCKYLQTETFRWKRIMFSSSCLYISFFFFSIRFLVNQFMVPWNSRDDINISLLFIYFFGGNNCKYLFYEDMLE
jgi:hypothetical protein